VKPPDEDSVAISKGKRGRPRRHPKPEEGDLLPPKEHKRAQNYSDLDELEEAPPKKRGRPRKYPRDDNSNAIKPPETRGASPRKRGRPRKYPREEEEAVVVGMLQAQQSIK
jgi:hypothetical protein